MIKIDLDIYWERYQLKTPNTRSPDNLIIPGSYFFNTIIIIIIIIIILITMEQQNDFLCKNE
jgi:hypothetical protein